MFAQFTIRSGNREGSEHFDRTVLGALSIEPTHNTAEEVRSYGDMVQSESDQNTELLDLSRQTLALTKELRSRSAGAGAANSDAVGEG